MKEFKKLSKRQQNIMKFMHHYMESQGYPPTIREIGNACDINSTSVVNYNLNKLVSAGYLERSDKVSRGLRIIAPIPGISDQRRVRPDNSVKKIGLVGRIAAGEPISLPEDVAHHLDEDDIIDVPLMLLNGYDESEVFALKVFGDSMIDSMIQHGDIVILRQQSTANNGDMVAAWLPDNNETTLKHFFKDNAEEIRLEPANPAYDTIMVHPANCEIKGKVLSVIRNMR